MGSQDTKNELALLRKHRRDEYERLMVLMESKGVTARDIASLKQSIRPFQSVQRNHRRRRAENG